ncbi:MAG: Hsp20/alpha crystallin family protein [Gammaproteobacteria bacterium]|nr:Hsp20/alpha crystallin family protein [Gammaproteobacteria bacterium]
MANITRFDPFDIKTFENAFEDFMQDFFRPMRYELKAKPRVVMDVSEDDKAYTVRAELPGVKKEDINITISGNKVTLTAEVKKEKEEKEGEKVVRSERYYGSLYRSFTLDQDINEAESQAKFADGVLMLTLPKKAAAAVKKLPIA